LWSTAHWGPAWFDGFWNPRFPRQITDRRLVAEPVATGVLEMEGKELRIIELGHTDTDGTSALCHGPPSTNASSARVAQRHVGREPDDAVRRGELCACRAAVREDCMAGSAAT
jgi:hypothetical protein